MMSDGQHHPHVHIMFSERFIDDVKKIKERPAKYFFSYPARKNIIRVAHRTLKAQKEAADKNGDTFLAWLFNRIPEECIGIISSKDDEKRRRANFLS